MYLRWIVLDLEHVEFKRYEGDFGFESAYVTEYVARVVFRQRHRTRGFNQLYVEGRSRPGAARAQIVAVNTLSVPVRFDLRAYRSLTIEERHEFFLAMLLQGSRKARRRFRLPLRSIERAIASFRAGGYQNVWVHATRRVPTLKLTAALVCELDPKRFTLTLQMLRGTEVVYRKRILTELPDPICYKHQFRELVVDRRFLTVLDEFGDRQFRISLSALAKLTTKPRALRAR